MQRRNVTSSTAVSIGYDETKRILEIEFKSGDIYQYVNVPKEIYWKLIDTTSVGKMIHRIIKDKFQYRKAN
jgi:hypothetical protein